ncbi:MAG: tetratricopeptide repeat protein [Bacteroidetes bacterium]|nr:tetratricopeptide repeat protein [Bacteroidota bacterium]
MRIRKIVFLLLLLLGQSKFISAQKTEIDSLVQLLNTSSETEKIDILNALSQKYVDKIPDKAIAYAKQARTISENQKADIKIGNSCLNIARGYYSKSDNTNALAFLNLAQNYFLKQNDKTGLAEVFNVIGNIQTDISNSNAALDYNLKALKIREELNDSMAIASSLINLGKVYYNLKDYKKANEYYTQSLIIREKINDEAGIAACYNNIANVYGDQGENQKALDFFQKSLSLKEKLGNKKGIAYTLNNIGSIYTALDNHTKAREYYLKSYEIKKEINDARGILSSLTNIGASYYYADDLNNAVKYFLLSSAQASEIGAKDIELSGYQNAAETYMQLKDFKKAAEYFSKSLSLKDSILSIESTKALHEMQAKFNFEKQEKEIKILKQETEIQALDVARTKLIKNGFIIGFILILIIAFIIYNRYQIKQKANKKLEFQKQEITRQHNALNVAYGQIEAKNKDITDSIKYAKRLQEAILPTAEFERTFSNNGFILYKPKDIVSGDFYWMWKKNNLIFVAAVDCTGHGVPGAFMSIVGHNLLNQAVKEHNLTTPSLILDEVNKGITQTLRQYEEESTVKDGMDISLCCLNTDTLELQYAGAFNPLWIIRNNSIQEITADKFPVGTFIGVKLNLFKNNTIQLNKGDQFYMFTDGYADQFGGPKGKKFKYKQLQELLLKNANIPLDKQKTELDLAFTSWTGQLEQIDDVLIIGIKA